MTTFNNSYWSTSGTTTTNDRSAYYVNTPINSKAFLIDEAEKYDEVEKYVNGYIDPHLVSKFKGLTGYTIHWDQYKKRHYLARSSERVVFFNDKPEIPKDWEPAKVRHFYPFSLKGSRDLLSQLQYDFDNATEIAREILS